MIVTFRPTSAPRPDASTSVLLALSVTVVERTCKICPAGNTTLLDNAPSLINTWSFSLLISSVLIILVAIYTIVHVEPSGTVIITPFATVTGPAVKAFLFVVIVYDDVKTTSFSKKLGSVEPCEVFNHSVPL